MSSDAVSAFFILKDMSWNLVRRWWRWPVWTRSAARRWCRRFNIPLRYRDYQELLDNPEIDAVSVCVPNFLHAEVAIAALRAGKHVLVEKPLARTAAEGEGNLRVAKEMDRIVGIVFNKRHRADFEYVGELARSGYFGDIYYAKAYWMRRSGIPGLGSWFTKKELAGGGPLIDLGVLHIIDASLWALGNPELSTVSASTFAKIGPQGKGNWPRGRFKAVEGADYEVEDLAWAFIRTTSGADAANWKFPGRPTAKRPTSSDWN